MVPWIRVSQKKNESRERGETLGTSESLLLNWANQISGTTRMVLFLIGWYSKQVMFLQWQCPRNVWQHFSAVVVWEQRRKHINYEPVLADVFDRFQVFWLVYGIHVIWYWCGTHTLSYLLFSVAPDLLYCRCMGENRHAVQLFTASQVWEASRQYVNSSYMLQQAYTRLLLKRYQVKNLNHVPDLSGYKDSHL